MISLFEILSNQDATTAAKYSTWFSKLLTREFFLQVREIDICIENRCYSCHFTQSFFFLPLQGASLSIGHGIAFTFQGWSSWCPRAVGITHHWIERWILIPDRPEKEFLLQIVWKQQNKPTLNQQSSHSVCSFSSEHTAGIYRVLWQLSGTNNITLLVTNNTLQGFLLLIRLFLMLNTLNTFYSPSGLTWHQCKAAE